MYKYGQFWNLFRLSILLYKKFLIKFIFLSLTFFTPVVLINHYFWQNTPLLNSIRLNISWEVYYLINGTLWCFVVLYFLLYFMSLIKTIHFAQQQKTIKLWEIYKETLSEYKKFFQIIRLYLFKVFSWSFLLLIPGIVMAVIYNYSVLAFLIDGKKGQDALMMSKKIIKTHYNKFLDYMLFMFLIYLVTCFPIILVLDLWISGFWYVSRFLLVYIFEYVQIYCIILLGIFPVIFYYYLYQELKQQS